MPLPLLFIGIAAATGGLGVGKTIKAGIDANNAKKINKNAKIGRIAGEFVRKNAKKQAYKSKSAKQFRIRRNVKKARKQAATDAFCEYK